MGVLKQIVASGSYSVEESTVELNVTKSDPGWEKWCKT